MTTAPKLKTRIKTPEQKPILLDVKMDQTGRLANDYVDILNEIRNRQESLDSLGAELVIQLKKQNRNDITVQNITLSIKGIEAKIKIAVKRQK